MNIYSRMAAVSVIGFATMAAYGAVSSDIKVPAQAQMPQAHPGGHMRAHMMMHHSPFIMALQQLDLTEAQHESIKIIVEASHAQMKSEFADHNGDYFALLNPGDPTYADAVRKAEAAATARIEHRSQDNTQIYNLLTPEQKAKLPEVLAKMKTHLEQHRAEWQHKGNAITGPHASH